jgi:hypothetical protein
LLQSELLRHCTQIPLGLQRPSATPASVCLPAHCESSLHWGGVPVVPVPVVWPPLLEPVPPLLAPVPALVAPVA